MRGILIVAAVFFVLAGAVLSVLPLLFPMVLAWGFNAGQGVLVMLGGFLLLAVQAMTATLQQAVAALRQLHQELHDLADTLPASLAGIAAQAAPSPAAPPPGGKEERAPSTGTADKRHPRQALSASEAARPPEMTPPAEAAPAARPGRPAPSAAGMMHEPDSSASAPPSADTSATSAASTETRQPSAPGEQASAGQSAASATPADGADTSSAEERDAAQQQSAMAQEAALYIVEEKTVRGHRARLLSDGTIEAELEEGWLRFENMEHLNEYLDALEQLRQKGML